MMTFVTGLLTVVLVLDCLLLVLLILIQLPKKEAGIGVAFGGGATDALFGAGSGTALTKLTKYTAGIFLGLSLLLSVMNAHRSGPTLEEQLQKKAAAGPVVAPPLVPTNPASGTNVGVPLLTPSNAAAANPTSPAATAPPAEPKK